MSKKSKTYPLLQSITTPNSMNNSNDSIHSTDACTWPVISLNQHKYEIRKFCFGNWLNLMLKNIENKDICKFIEFHLVLFKIR